MTLEIEQNELIRRDFFKLLAGAVGIAMPFRSVRTNG